MDSPISFDRVHKLGRGSTNQTRPRSIMANSSDKKNLETAEALKCFKGNELRCERAIPTPNCVPLK